jgi:hypothetical protein
LTAPPALTGAPITAQERSNIMPYITTVVYLNDADHHFCGFNTFAPAQLREAARFDLEILDHVPSQYVMPGALEIVFEQLNIPTPNYPWAIAYRRAGRRSLSVGDVVVIAETAWACADTGWTPVSADELHAALVTH